MNDSLDDLLESAALEPPDGFARSVIEQLEDAASARARYAPAWISWVAVICGAVLGLDELGSFVLAAWIATPAH
jgi:hypothetical protein